MYRFNISRKNLTYSDIAHLNFVCLASDQGPMALSLCEKEDGNYTGLLRAVDGNRRLEVKAEDIRVSFFRNLFRLGPSVASYVKAASPTLPGNSFKKVDKPDLPNFLLEFEEKQTIKGFKFGLMYCAPGQVREDEIFTNGLLLLLIVSDNVGNTYCDFGGCRAW